ncbi:acyl-CoA dehydrogenase [Amycolatopsis sp. NPDC058278]|uniref:acyl-CoA dehydrogenase family protein n=1 Tax=Amycolatopsis sp. NPDC058278 TaxID=3346417 RepID=UPI0036DBC664
MPADDDFRHVLAKLFRHEVFQPRAGMDYRQRCELTYERLRVVGEHLPPGSALLQDLPKLFAALEWAAVADPPLFLALTLHVCLSLGAIVEFGGGRAERHVRELDDMTSFGALLVTEVGRGNSHLGIRTVAEYHPATGGFVLRTPDEAARKFMPNVGLVHVPKTGVVYARLLAQGRDYGVFPFVTPIRTIDGTPDGVRVVPLPEAPLLPLDYALIEFRDLLLPPTALLSDNARLDADGVLDDPLGDPERRLRRSLDIRHNAWVAAAAAAAAVARAGVVMALRHARSRNTVSPFTAERNVLDHRAQQRPLFGALADCYALTRVVERIKITRIRSQAGAPAGEEISDWTSGSAVNRTYGLIKAYASSAAAAIVTECGLRCGAHGIFTPGRWVEYQGLAHMLGPAAGDGYLIVLEAARGMAAGDHYTPPPPDDLVEEDPFTPVSWLRLARARERLLHERLVERMRLARRRGQTEFEAWNNRASSGVGFVEAHVARLVLEAVAGTPAAPAGPATRLADALHALHALRGLTKHAGFYLREALLTAEQIDRLTERDNELCDRVLADLDAVPHLLNAPEELLRHPLQQ